MTAMQQNRPRQATEAEIAAEACDLARRGDYAASRARGNEAPALADARVVRAAGLGRRIVSFSLFGAEPAYCETAILNARAMPAIYPGWAMWVFHDASVPPEVLARLREAGANLADAAASGLAHWPGTFWRFAAPLIPGAEKVIFRDADSVVGERERRLVEAWLADGRPFHVIRDWYSHVELVLAGLWGAHAPFLAGMRGWVDAYVKRGNLHPTHADQHFLAEIVWPRIRGHVLVHDSVHDAHAAVPFEAAPLAPNGSGALGAFRLKEYRIQVQGVTAPYLLCLLDGQGREVFRYRRHLRNGEDVFELPYEQADRIQSGEWRLELRRV
jgi:hypothetical protein